MQRMLDYQTYLAVLKRWFHQGETPGEYVKPEPVYHSLGGKGGACDKNGNRLGPDGKVLGRTAAFYGAPNSINAFTGRKRGEWLQPSGAGRAR